MTSPEAMFVPDGRGTYEPTTAAVGPWSPDALHGAAVAALFAARLTPADRTLARLTVELVRPVPAAPLQLEILDAEGGRRAQRQEARLCVDGATVAIARSLTVRRLDLDLPPEVRDHPSPFPPDRAPALEAPDRNLVGVMGWENLHTTAVATARIRVDDDPVGLHQWVALTVPVIAGEPLAGPETAAVAADFAGDAVHPQIPYGRWSFMNAEISLHLSRPPVGRWVGMRSDAVVQAVGTGFTTADLYDADGRLGRSSSSLVVEPRSA